MADNRAFVARLRASGGPSHELLVLLDAHRVLTTDQLARATGTPVRTVRHRLDRLRTAGLVDAVRPGREAGSAPRHWWLRVAGARLVAGTAAAPGRQRPSGLHVAHAAAIAEVWLAVRDHGPSAGLVLRRWWSDRAGWQEWETTRPGYGSRVRRLTPDAALLADVDVDSGGAVGAAAAFVEVDLATMSQTVLREKVTRYLAYAHDQAWEGRWPHCPPLLLLTTTQARAVTFLTAVRKQLAAARRPVWGGQAGRDIVDANSLVVAACGLVRDPAAAVDAPVWLLPDPAAGGVTLPELLAARITAQARAQHHHDQAAADAARQDRVEQLAAIRNAAEQVARLLGAAAGDLVAHWYPADLSTLLVDDPPLADALCDWWTDRDDPERADRARQALTRRHTTAWTRQAAQLLDAAGHGDHPRVRAAAATLAAGRLLLGHDIDQLGRRPARTWSQIQHAVLEDYRASRDDQVAAVWARSGWRARRHTSVAQLGADYDREHLLVCGTCAIAYLRPDPDGPHWQDSEVCPHCHTGTPLPYGDRNQVPTLDVWLTAIRARLTTGGKATSPPPPAG